MRSLEQWLDYQAQVHPQAIDLGLERLRTVLERLAWQQPTVPVITVAGTNGKGSVSAYCTAILRAAGFKVGTFTSPHLRDYRERIRVHERLARAEELVAVFEKIEAARGSVALTFFEFNALAALLIFEAARSMRGCSKSAWAGVSMRSMWSIRRSPSSPVLASIIRNTLGDTLEAIAREKAGIFRPGKPAVIGGREPLLVLEDLRAQPRFAAEAAGHRIQLRSRWRRLALPREHWDLPHLPAPALNGDIQFANAATALAALEELSPRLTISAAAVASGLTGVHLAGRFQSFSPAPTRRRGFWTSHTIPTRRGYSRAT